MEILMKLRWLLVPSRSWSPLSSSCGASASWWCGGWLGRCVGGNWPRPTLTHPAPGLSLLSSSCLRSCLKNSQNSSGKSWTLLSWNWTLVDPAYYLPLRQKLENKKVENQENFIILNLWDDFRKQALSKSWHCQGFCQCLDFGSTCYHHTSFANFPLSYYCQQHQRIRSIGASAALAHQWHNSISASAASAAQRISSISNISAALASAASAHHQYQQHQCISISAAAAVCVKEMTIMRYVKGF